MSFDLLDSNCESLARVRLRFTSHIEVSGIFRGGTRFVPVAPNAGIAPNKVGTRFPYQSALLLVMGRARSKHG